jgi:hypothetical protein
MTPKEKAQELVGKCFDTFINDKDEHYVETAWKLSKQFALIAVDEILKVTVGLNGWIDGFQYWEEVKQEIEKL